MKTNFYKIICFVAASLILVFSGRVNAQIANYIFTQSNGTYAPLTVGFVLGDAATNDQFFVDPNTPLGGTNVLGAGLPIGFNFTYNDTVYNKFGICANGWIILGNGFVDFTNANLTVPLSSPLRTVIAALGRDLEAQTNATLSYASLGTAPNRTLIIQWQNYARFNNFAADSLNFQIRLNESDNSISVVYGKVMSGSNQTNISQVGMKGGTTQDLNMRTTPSNWTTTTATTVNTEGCPINSAIFPPNGLTFNWIPPFACTAPPTAGTATAAVSPTCSALKIISLTGNSTGIGTSFQWLVSADSLNWSPVLGATSTSYSINQTSSNYYRAVITCSGITDSSNVVLVTGTSSTTTCYCTTNLHAQPGCNFGFLNDITISGTNFSNTISGCSGLNGNSYTSYADTGNFTTSLFAGLTYNFNVTTSGGGSISMWIDYNQNGSFEPTEWTQIAAAAQANTPNSLSVTIPLNASLGKTGVRFRYRGGNGQNGAGDACLNFQSGETEDYLITIAQQAPCSAPPTAGVASSNATAVCAGVNYTLQLTGNSIGSGLTFQWQSSVDSLNWSDIIGATNSFYTIFALQNTYYRAYLTCSGISDTSNVVGISINAATLCYCSTNLHNNPTCNNGTISDVTIAATNFSNLASGCGGLSGNSYSAYPASGNTTTTLDIGGTYILNVTTGSNNNINSVWIDFDQNGSFDTYEWTQVSTNSVSNVTNSVTLAIPVTALPGLTGMRIRSRLLNGINADSSACTQFGSGETEDYFITLVQQPPCSAPPIAGLIVSSDSSVCAGIPFTLTLSGATSGSGMSYVWQSSADSITWTIIAGAGSALYTHTQNQSTYYRAILTCSGMNDTSSLVHVVQNLSSNCYCTSGANSAADADLGNITFGTLNNGSATPVLSNVTATGTYTNYTALPAQTFNQSTAYPISVSQITSNANFFGARITVFIDYNQNGLFTDVGERVFTGTTTMGAGGNVSTLTGTVTIPATATLGNTRLRVILAEGAGPGIQNPCGNFQFGETEDYTITIDQFNAVRNLNTAAISMLVFPNPTDGKTILNYIVSEKSLVSIEVFNLVGEKITTLINESKGAGNYINELDLKQSGIEQGIYLLKLNAGGFSKTIRLVVF